MVPTVQTPVKEHREGPRRHPIRAYFDNIRHAVYSTFEGMSVTMSWMFRRPMTIQYPDRMEKSVQESLPENYRGLLEVDLDRCTACLLCQKACPLGCISIEVCKNPATGNRDMTKFDIDNGLCMFCGLCAEACNFDALVHTTEFEGTVTSPAELKTHFVTEPREVTKLKTPEMPPRRPRGSILADLIPNFGRRNKGKDGLERFGPPAPRPVPPPPAPKPAAEPAPPAAGDPPAAPAPPEPPVAPKPPAPHDPPTEKQP
jgi:NADH-quinone oxidoreductase subunit I